jgi:hypothetical protein
MTRRKHSSLIIVLVLFLSLLTILSMSYSFHEYVRHFIDGEHTRHTDGCPICDDFRFCKDITSALALFTFLIISLYKKENCDFHILISIRNKLLPFTSLVYQKVRLNN